MYLSWQRLSHPAGAVLQRVAPGRRPTGRRATRDHALLRTILVGGLLLLAGAAAADSPDRALELLRAGRSAEAEPLLEALVQERPGDGRRHYFLGFCRLSMFRFLEAEASLQRAVELDPGQASWWQALGKARFEQGRYREAMTSLRRAVELDPSPGNHFALAAAALNASEPQVAESELRACLAREAGHAQALFELGRIEADRGDDEQAAVLFRRALAADPSNVEARFRLGLSSARLGRDDEARAAHEAVLQAVPGHAGALYQLARLEQAAGRKEEARRRLAEFREVSRLEDEIRFRQEFVRLAPEDPEQRLSLAESQLAAGRTLEALEQLEHARRLAPAEPRAYRLLGRALRLVGRGEEASRAEAFAASLEGGNE